MFATVQSVEFAYQVISQRRNGMNIKPIAVVVVEDELLLRISIAGELEDEGFLVFEASNADEAIAIIQANPTIHALFTDIDMPGSMDGLKLAAFVRDRWPPIKIILTSGHHDLAGSGFDIDGKFFPKPYKATEVANQIRQMTAIC
jgi:DNA-binding NtrC family response regulator